MRLIIPLKLHDCLYCRRARWCSATFIGSPPTHTPSTHNVRDKHLICPRPASVRPSIIRAKAKRKVTCAGCKYRLAAFLYPQSQSQQPWTTSKPRSVSAQPGQHGLPCVGVRCPPRHDANATPSAERGWHSCGNLCVFAVGCVVSAASCPSPVSLPGV